MDSQKIDLYIFRILLFVSAIVLGYIAVFSEVHYAGSESIYHFFHAKAIFKHPEIMINHWGKPLFILLSSPFAYFGETGAKLFNVLVMILSAYLAFKIGKKLGFKYAFPTVFLVIFTPVYLPFAQSALTEPLFGLVALIGAYLFLNEKYIFSAIVISFIIFARSEGMMFILLYAFMFLLKKQYKAIPYLFFGFILYGFLGLIFNHGFLWYYYDYPYNGAVDIYGKGPFWNYFINQEHIFGTPFSIASCLSVFLLLVNFKAIEVFLKDKMANKFLIYFTLLYSIFLFFFIRNNELNSFFSVPFLILLVLLFFFIIIYFFLNKEVRGILIKNISNKMVFLFLIVFPAIIYVFAHSYLWYKGLGSAVGLYRIVGAIIPLLAVLVLFGFNKIVELLPVFTKYHNGLSIFLLLVFGVILVSYTYSIKESFLLIQPDAKEKLILKSIDYIENNNLDNRKLYVYQAHFIARFNGDHFDRNNSKVIGGLSKPNFPESCTKKGDIVIWDGHVSPNEGRLPIRNLENNTNFKELIEFRPEEEFRVLGGGFYYIKIFERI